MTIAAAKPAPDNSSVSVCWDDGRSEKYSALWLRDNCPSFHLAVDRQLNDGDHSEVSTHSSFANVNVPQSGQLNVAWKDGHVSVFPAKFLRRFQQDAITKMKASLPEVLCEKNPVPRVQYQDLAHDAGIYKALKAINDLGCVTITGCPITKESIHEVTTKICEVPMYLAHYGTGGEFVTGAAKTKSQLACPNCVCNVPNPIELHQDNPYQQEVPGLFFHFCQRLDDGVVGGSNMVMDAFHVAETLRLTDPEAFEVLSTTNILYEKDQGGPSPVKQSVERPIISVGSDGVITEVVYSAFWSKTHHLTEDELQRFVMARQAWKAVIARLKDEGFEVSTPMTPGDCTILNNKRVMHGRLPFVTIDGIRQMYRSYGSESLWLNRYKVLQKTQEGIEATHVHRGGSALALPML